MRARTGIIWVAMVAVVVLSACARDREPRLMNIRSASRSPDEFTVLPSKPLQMPEDIASLPVPTPGGANITDPTPEADAIAALGGRPEVLAAAGSAASTGLIAHVSRFGVSSDIRPVLAAEDLDWRRGNSGRLLERLAGTNRYFKAYQRMALDKYVELERWRAAGVRTVGAPPPDQAP